MTKEKKEGSKKKINFKKEIFGNYWRTSATVLAMVLILMLIFGNSLGMCGLTISANTAGQKVIDFAEQQGVEATIVETNKQGSLYEVVLSMQGEEFPIYITSDGKNLVPSLIPLEKEETQTPTTQTTTEIPKSERPVVELYVWSYCPYGVQAQGPMAEVANLLGNSADFRIVPYYDGHGAYETQENQIESCIQKLEPEKYWNYAAEFVEKIYPKCAQERTASCDLNEATSLMNSLGIDSEAVLACVESEGDALNNAASQKARENGVTGSPTIIINGVKANVARNADAIKTAVCSSFTNAPAECSTELDSSSAVAEGNC